MRMSCFAMASIRAVLWCLPGVSLAGCSDPDAAIANEDGSGTAGGSISGTTDVEPPAGTADVSNTAGASMGASDDGDDCTHAADDCTPAVPMLDLSFSQVKRFDFAWSATPGADYYQLLERASPTEPYVQLGEDVVGQSVSFVMPLHFRWQASYVLRACNAVGCTDSVAVEVMSSLAEAVGYVKASNTEAADWFGASVALSRDGNTLAVSAPYEDSSATGIEGNQADDSATDSGAVYVFVRDGAGAWSQQAYVKASNTEADDYFGRSVTLSGDGNTLVVGAYVEDSNAVGIGGNQANDSAPLSGAVYVFVRDGAEAWSQQAYVKASNTGGSDLFGTSVALSDDGDTLAVGAYGEDSDATGIEGNQTNENAYASGAVYVFVRDAGAWSQQAYVKASNTGADDDFGISVALSGDGDTLAVGAFVEDSSATGIGGSQTNNSATDSGAVYVFVREGTGVWSQQAYVKASNTGAYDRFGLGIALSADGKTLAVGAYLEDSNATGNQANDSSIDSGAAYVFVRDGAGAWSQQAYVKASNTGVLDQFGYGVALSADGNTLAVGARSENSSATGIEGSQADESASAFGAVYVFVREEVGAWSQHAYVKASNTEASDEFSYSMALSGDGKTLAVGAYQEDSSAKGIAGDQADNGALDAGAVYLF